MEYFATGLAWYVTFLFSVTFHEASHAWVAKLGGDLTAYHGGQVSINPFPHMRREPFGMLVFPLVSLAAFDWPFGYASTPFDPEWSYRHPRRAAWMSLAGPVSNLLLALAAGLLIRGGIAYGVLTGPDTIALDQVTLGAAPGYWEGLARIASMFFSLNLMLGVLNLIPLPPLDGSGILPLFLSRGLSNYYNQWIRQPILGWIGLLLAWKIFTPIFRPVFIFALNLLYPGAGYG